ncbi:hypothetical protein ACHAXA_008101 [Cyclostephanos tholiformis]|uniref:Uncharacterized protein n=1 Tax=Cyclostephanos tholiformis TaxID=382380 RepID=A0ABD3RVQ8_9STRA
MQKILYLRLFCMNLEGLYAVMKGTECPGVEHEVIVKWPLSSGKFALAIDQHEVFVAVCNSTKTKLWHTWRNENSHTFFVITHAATLSIMIDRFHITNPDRRQYDLFVYGARFFHMPLLCAVGVGLNVASVGDDLNDPPQDYSQAENGDDTARKVLDHNVTRACAKTAEW